MACGVTRSSEPRRETALGLDYRWEPAEPRIQVRVRAWTGNGLTALRAAATFASRLFPKRPQPFSVDALYVADKRVGASSRRGQGRAIVLRDPAQRTWSSTQTTPPVS